MTARETTTNVRTSHAEKQEWEQAAREDGLIRHEGETVIGNVSRWLRELGNREVQRRKRRK